MKPLSTLLFSLLFLSAFANGKVEYGLATIYADEYAGSYTASGNLYDPGKHTGAHKSLPFGSIVKVTNMENGKSLLVTINDRGPFIKGYVIELSGSSAETLALEGKRPKVKLEVKKEGVYETASEIKGDDFIEPTTSPFVVEGDIPESYEEKSEVKSTATETKTGKAGATPAEDLSPKGAGEEGTKKETTGENTGTPSKKSSSVRKAPNKKGIPLRNNQLTHINDKGFGIYELYKTSTFDPKDSGYGMQVGVYNDLQNVLKKTAILQENWFSNIMLTRETEGDKLVYKVIVGPFEERESAVAYTKSANRKGVKGYVVAIQPAKGREIYQIKAVRPERKGYAVQIMNLDEADNVILEVDKLRKRWFKNILVEVREGDNGQPDYKILLGPFPNRKTADSYKKSLAKKKLDGFTVDLSSL